MFTSTYRFAKTFLTAKEAHLVSFCAKADIVAHIAAIYFFALLFFVAAASGPIFIQQGCTAYCWTAVVVAVASLVGGGYVLSFTDPRRHHAPKVVTVKPVAAKPVQVQTQQPRPVQQGGQNVQQPRLSPEEWKAQKEAKRREYESRNNGRPAVA